MRSINDIPLLIEKLKINYVYFLYLGNICAIPIAATPPAPVPITQPTMAPGIIPSGPINSPKTPTATPPIVPPIRSPTAPSR